ncbi:WecB/TagA/CpsF family glycosyltransferase [Ochrobactrum sp. CM-21-5]|nr:WecB/TagA/CpsF family glycosyltransferase [Ochrobactrum sp. CM-21-5]MBC2887494.1 WecB/TagA/CpsF family glycosyltransferase [Ochrobactrum sp. CM-21-5]
MSSKPTTENPAYADAAGLEYRNILGIPVACLDWNEALDFVQTRIDDRSFLKLGWLNAHCANVAQADPDYRNALRNFLVLPDGIGVDIASKISYSGKFPANLNGTDFIPRLLQHIERPLRVGLIGGKKSVPEEAAEAFCAMAPQHDYRAIADGYFTPQQMGSILQELAAFQPDILLVAMGVPLQELFIEKNIEPRHCTVACAVGALFDFQAGVSHRAPEWVRKLRMEWAYRLLCEPGRLAKRYLVGNPLFLWRVMLGGLSKRFRKQDIR